MTVITNRTIEVLKNFSSINKSIVIKPGNQIATLSINKNILAIAKVEEQFESQIAIYDLQSFLSGLSLHGSSPQLDSTNSNFIIISDADKKVKTRYFYADPDIITQAPDKGIELPTEEVSFHLSSNVLDNLRKASFAYKVPDLCVYGHDGKIQLAVTDKRNDTSNTYTVEVGETDGEFCYCFKMENIKLLDDDYKVIVSKQAAKFIASDVTYFIALETNG